LPTETVIVAHPVLQCSISLKEAITLANDVEHAVLSKLKPFDTRPFPVLCELAFIGFDDISVKFFISHLSDGKQT
jgi:hypothetical protein